MKAIITPLMIVVFVFCVASCSPTTPLPSNQNSSDIGDAQQVLTSFLKNLHNGNYDKAAKQYGGTYEVMIEQNPSADRSDPAGLLKNACTINGYECLKVKSVVLEENSAANEFTFKVELVNNDGTLFTQGPCCGGNETDSPSQSSFLFKVIRDIEGKFWVMDMPPYTP